MFYYPPILKKSLNEMNAIELERVQKRTHLLHLISVYFKFYYCLKKGLIFMLIDLSEYHEPFQFIHTMPSSVPCLAIYFV